MKTKQAMFFALAAVGSSAVGCSHEHDRRANEPSTTSRNDVTPPAAESRHEDEPSAPAAGGETASASEQIARSRCQREVACNNVGPDRKFSSVDDCISRIRADWRDDL